MGVGKATVDRRLQKQLERSVFLNGDCYWDTVPFQVTEEAKTMRRIAGLGTPRLAGTT